MNTCKYIGCEVYALPGSESNANPLRNVRNEGITANLTSISNTNHHEEYDWTPIGGKITNNIGAMHNIEQDVESTQLKSESNISCSDVEDWSGSSSGIFLSKKKRVCN